MIPDNISHYEFPDFIPNQLRQQQQIVQQVPGIKANLKDYSRPSFLVTRLNEQLVTLRRINFNEAQRKLSIDSSEITSNRRSILNLGISPGAPTFVVLVAASGAGKTRFLCEELFNTFGVFITAKVIGGANLGDSVGSLDLATFLAEIPRDPSSLLFRGIVYADAEKFRHFIAQAFMLLLFVRVVIFQHMKRIFGNTMQPRHWLAMQLYPTEFFGADVFREAYVRIRYTSYNFDFAQSWRECGFTFIGLDEAQIINGILPGQFLSRQENLPREKRLTRSALAPFFDLLVIPTNIVLSGTGLEVYSAIEIAGSSAARQSTRIVVGISAYLARDDLMLMFKKMDIWAD
jgi:hypothetical protein